MKRLEKQTKGYLSNVGPDIKVRRVLPSVEVRELNPFVFLDVMVPSVYAPNSADEPAGTGAHPHRGFATLTYMLEGEIEHFDSRGNHGVVSAGGAQWMLAGNGIVHDEKPTLSFLKAGGTRLGFQLWINVPKEQKALDPAYMPLPVEQIQSVELNGGATLKVIMGQYAEKTSPLPTYTPMAIYRVHLPAGQTTTLDLNEGWQTGIYLNTGQLQLGAAKDNMLGPKLAVISKSGQGLEVHNPTETEADFFVFTALPLTEPMLAHGPFVMNDERGIIQAYQDYELGKYGEITNYHMAVPA